MTHRWLAILVALLVATPAFAAVVLALDLPQLTEKSDLIVRGTVESSAAAWTSGGRVIQTLTHVRVAETLKGEAQRLVEVRTRGGTVGDVSQKVEGAPTFAPGEQVFLFLRRLPNTAQYAVVGLAQGKLTVAADPKLGDAVQGSTTGLVKPDASGKLVPVGAVPATGLADFTAQVRQLVARGQTP